MTKNLIEKPSIESITKGTSLKVLLESSYSGTHIIESIAKGTNLKVGLELSYSRMYNYMQYKHLKYMPSLIMVGKSTKVSFFFFFFFVVVEGIKKQSNNGNGVYYYDTERQALGKPFCMCVNRRK